MVRERRPGRGAPVEGARKGCAGEEMMRRGPETVLGPPLESFSLVHILAIDKRGGVIIPKEVRERMDGPGEGKMLLVAEMVDGTTPMITLVPVNRPPEKAETGPSNRLTPRRR